MITEAIEAGTGLNVKSLAAWESSAGYSRLQQQAFLLMSLLEPISPPEAVLSSGS